VNEPHPANILECVAATIRRHGLLEPGQRVVLAVSGGADSMALLDVLAEVGRAMGLWLCVAHLDHGLRGPASAADAAFVAREAAERGLEARVERADVAADRARHGGSLEAAARRVRYDFLSRVAHEVRADRVATGHTADDQVETIVLGLLRGGGLTALCGMPVSRPLGPASRTLVVRPLLESTRAQLLAHLRRRAIPWREDATNADIAFERNCVRHEVLAYLEKGTCPDVRETLLALASTARVLKGVVGRLAGGLVSVGEGAAEIDARRLAQAPRLVRRAAARLAHERLGGTRALTRRALDAVEELLEKAPGTQVSLAGGLVAQRGYDAVILRPPSPAPAPVARTLAIPGRVEVPQTGHWVEVETLDRCPANPLDCLNADPWEEVVDLDAVGDRLELRTRRPGDRFVPLGLGSPTKLKDFLINQRVPRDERARTLLVTGRQGIVWVVGRRLDDRAKVTPATCRAARLRAGRLGASRSSTRGPDTGS